MKQAAEVITKKTPGDCAYLFAAPKLWNSLPYLVRCETNLIKF